MPRQHTVKSSLHSWQPTITNEQQGEQDTKERIHGDCHSVSTGIIVHAVHYAIHKPTSLISNSCASSKEELQIATKYKRANREKTTLEWKLAFFLTPMRTISTDMTRQIEEGAGCFLLLKERYHPSLSPPTLISKWCGLPAKLILQIYLLGCVTAHLTVGFLSFIISDLAFLLLLTIVRPVTSTCLVIQFSANRLG